MTHKPDATVAAVAQRIVDAGLTSAAELRGCTADEIEEIEKTLKLRLPRVYRRYLEVMGRNAGQFLRGTHAFFPMILNLRQPAEALLQQSAADFRLTNQHLVFADHQGYQFLFFDISGGDDPAVYHFLEGERKPRKVFKSFSAWLHQCAEDDISMFLEERDDSH